MTERGSGRSGGPRGRSPAGLLVVALLACATAGPESATQQPASEAVLRFVGASGAARELSLASLRTVCPTKVVEVADPYHARRVRYWTLDWNCVLARGFGVDEAASALAGESVLLRALDGYTRPVSGPALLEPGAHLAFGEASQGSESAPQFSKIDRRRVDPGPFYLVWEGAAQGDPHTHPWPYQLSTIEIASFAEAFARTVPEGLAESDPGWRGYAIFREACAACHSINGQGGKVGPELNLPRSIVEYRPVAQIRAYIRDPQATRYTSMPAHPGLGEDDLDALIAYFRAMSERKHDPRDGSGG